MHGGAASGVLSGETWAVTPSGSMHTSSPRKMPEYEHSISTEEPMPAVSAEIKAVKYQLCHHSLIHGRQS